MADSYLKFVNAPFGRWLASSVGLPQPVPLQRDRPDPPGWSAPLILDGAPGGRLLEVLRARFEAAGTALLDPEVDAPATTPPKGLVFDASGIAAPEQLEALYRFLHRHARRLAPCGRVLLLGAPPDHGESLSARTAQRALEGLLRSLAKELRRGSTAQLLQVEAGAEVALESSLRFFLSGRSAYVSGQTTRLARPVDGHPPFERERPLAGRRALVTGASRGIGEAIAQALAREGATLTCLDVPQAQAPLQQLAQDLGGDWLALDITAADAGERLLWAARERGGYDIVVHNAGITRDKTLARMDEAQWREVIAVNLQAPLQLSTALLDGDGLRRGGRIVCISSISGIAGNRGQTNYAASKAGVIGLVQGLAEHAAALGITANAVAPGFIETQMTARIPLAIREAGRRMNSLAQGGLPIDVAEAVAWLAHPGSGGVNGQVLRVCGQSLIGA